MGANWIFDWIFYSFIIHTIHSDYIPEKMKQKTCSVKNCFQDRAMDDKLFCTECRLRWRSYCIDVGLTLDETDESVESALEVFKNG